MDPQRRFSAFSLPLRGHVVTAEPNAEANFKSRRQGRQYKRARGANSAPQTLLSSYHHHLHTSGHWLISDFPHTTNLTIKTLVIFITMVAVNRSLLAFSLASISLVDAAALPSPPSSPSKPPRQPRQQRESPVPFPMKRLVRERAPSSPTKGGRKSRVAEADTPSKRQQDQVRFDSQPHQSRQLAERDVPANGTAGRIDVTQENESTGNRTAVACLVYNTTSGCLDASPSECSTLWLVPASQASPARGDQQVALQMPMTNSDVPFCGTFNPNPPSPEPICMKPCGAATTADSSQVFAYREDDGTVSPMWNNADGSNSTVAQRDTSAVSPQDVVLIFVPQGAPAAQEAVSPSSSESASSSSSTSTSQPASQSSQATSSPAAPVTPPKPSVGIPVSPPVPAPARQAATESASQSSPSAPTSSASALPVPTSLPAGAPAPPVGVLTSAAAGVTAALPVAPPGAPAAPAPPGAPAAAPAPPGNAPALPAAPPALPAGPAPAGGAPAAPVPARQAASASASVTASSSQSLSASASSDSSISSQASPSPSIVAQEVDDVSSTTSTSTSSDSSMATSSDSSISSTSASSSDSSTPSATPAAGAFEVEIASSPSAVQRESECVKRRGPDGG
ncbi:hypothetical protein C8R46DRAFT_1188230 [Mycena filopes]|nr:hypothetical protein C8R46DRAFT_1188230 [Mycena filopes]